MGREKKKKTDPTIYAWDGEGATVRNRHVYTLFAGSCGIEIENQNGLANGDALAALAMGLREYKGLHVGFAIGYDVNLMLRGLPRKVLERIWTGEKTYWTDARHGMKIGVEWRPRKYLNVTTWRRGDTKGTGGTWWDVWPFFQRSFVAALDAYGVGSAEIRERIREMKRARSTFTAADADAVRRYNQSELTLLVELVEALRTSIRAADIHPKRWDGPGALASDLLTRHDAAHLASAECPERALDAFQYAYYGGRIECARYGTTRKKVWQYDVNSAYPAAMRSLPCRSPECGAWQRVERGRVHQQNAFAVYHVRWAFPHRRRFYPLPWRSKNGSVFFPRQGEGWCWSPEYWAAYEAGGWLDVVESWRWIKTCDHEIAPYAWIDDVYQERQKAKARGDAAEHALKLALNSLYGKLAQRVGAKISPEGKLIRPPPFHDLAGAGWITASIRSQLYRAAMTDPAAVIMLATDGVFSERPLQIHAPKEKVLGGWSLATWAGATVVQSGVYWLHDPAHGDKIYSRGFDADSLDRSRVRAAWKRGAQSYEAEHTRFIGLGLALAGLPSSEAGRAAFKKWCQWITDPRTMKLHPWGTKRTPRNTAKRSLPHKALVDTSPADTSALWSDPHGTGLLAMPSPVPWRPLVGAEYTDPADRALAESEEAAL